MLIFTNDDYRRIQAWLKKNAIKDSDFAISQETVPEEDILVITQNMATVPTNYKIKIKDLLNSSLGKVVIDSITAKSVKVNNVLTVDAANVKLDNEKGTTLQDVLNYFEENKLNRHTDDTFDGNLTIKKDLTIEGHIKSDDGLTTVEENFEATGEITDGQGNMLSDVNSAAKGWKIEYQDPQQDEPTVRAKYVLKDYKGVPKGNVIKVYKDSAITNVYLGTTEDTCNPDTGEVTKKPIHDNNEALSIVYRLDTGKYMLVNVPLGIFTREAEFDKYRGLGIEPNGQVFIKLASDVESTNYLHFNSLGEIAADGIEARILRDLGTLISSVAGDGTMWGTYKKHEGTLEDSTPNDGSRWGEYKEAEAHRDALSNSNNIVYHEDWDDSEGPEWIDPVTTESNIAYNWKTADTPASDGKSTGNLKDLYQKTLDNEEAIKQTNNRTAGITKEIIATEEEEIIIEDNNDKQVAKIDSTGADFKNLKSNGVTVATVGQSYTKEESDAKYLTEHQDISGKADKTDVEALQDKTSEVLKEVIETDDDSISIEDNNGNEVFHLDESGLDAKNVKSNGKDVLTEHQDISGLATKADLEKAKVKEISEENVKRTDEAIIITTDDDTPVTKMHTELTEDDEECQVWASDDYDNEGHGEKYAKITPKGVSAKGFFDINGNPIGNKSNSSYITYPKFILGAIAINDTIGAWLQDATNRLRTGYIRAKKGDRVSIKETKDILFLVMELSGTEPRCRIMRSEWMSSEYTVQSDECNFIQIVARHVDESDFWGMDNVFNNIYVERVLDRYERDVNTSICRSMPFDFYVSTKTEFESKALTLDDIYGGYASLVSSYPSYVTQETLGKDQSGVYDIFAYKFTPEKIDSQYWGETRLAKLPKVIITACIHGNERPCARALLNLVTHVCRDWKDNKVLSYLRNHVELIIVPVVNPWGYANNKRQNVNNVDLNRNFYASGDWINGDDNPNSENYRGTEPYSESETKIINRLVMKNADAIAYYSLHTHGVFNKGWDYMTCFAMAGNYPNDVLTSVGEEIIKEITISGWENHNLPPKENWDDSPTDKHSDWIGIMQKSMGLGYSDSDAASYGVAAASPEVMWGFYKGSFVEQYDINTDCLNEEYVCGIIMSVIKNNLINN